MLCFLGNQDSISEAPCFRARRNFPKAIIKIARVQGARPRSMHKSIDGETANEEGIQSVRPQPCSGEGIDCSPLDDDQTGLSFIAKSLPSSCRRCVVYHAAVVVRLALRHPNFPVPPRPSLRVHFRLRRLSLDRTNEIGRTGGRGRTDMPTPSSLRPSFASAQTTCC